MKYFVMFHSGERPDFPTPLLDAGDGIAIFSSEADATKWALTSHLCRVFGFEVYPWPYHGEWTWETSNTPKAGRA